MPSSLLLEIRADGGKRWGFGHVGRCLAIAQALDGCAAFRLSDPGLAAFVTDRGGVLAPDQARPAVVLLDGVAPTPRERVDELHVSGTRVVLLDDFGSGRETADLVIDPPTGTHWPPTGGKRLAGFEHALLRSEVLAASRSDRRHGVLVAMGGSDPGGLTEPISAALAARGLPVAAAIGPGYSSAPPRAVDRLIAGDDFVTALARADLVVTAYGHILIEAAYFGVPAVACVLREDQLPHARAFCVNGTATMIDATLQNASERAAAAAVALLTDEGTYAEMAGRGPSLVDGRGARRVAMAIRGLA